MSEHKVTIQWKRSGADFLQNKYSREHTWAFDGGATVAASSSPSVVPVPHSNPANVDPEEAFVAAVSSCHMLWFLSLAAGEGFVVDSYVDEAVGLMTRNESGVLWISSIRLKPKVAWSGDKRPTSEEERQIRRHH